MRHHSAAALIFALLLASGVGVRAQSSADWTVCRPGDLVVGEKCTPITMGSGLLGATLDWKPLDFDSSTPLPDGWAASETIPGATAFAFTAVGTGEQTTLNVGVRGCLVGPMEMRTVDQLVFAIPAGKSIPAGCAKDVIDEK